MFMSRCGFRFRSRNGFRNRDRFRCHNSRYGSLLDKGERRLRFRIRHKKGIGGRSSRCGIVGAGLMKGDICRGKVFMEGRAVTTVSLLDTGISEENAPSGARCKFTKTRVVIMNVCNTAEDLGVERKGSTGGEQDRKWRFAG